MVNNGYFDTPFAVGGDLNPIPDAVQPGGTVSYEQGFPVGYSTPVTSGGFNVPRTAINQVLFDITSAVQQYQQHGIPPFITTTMNGGTPFSYAKYATVLSGGVAYQSNTSSNTDTPPSSKWTPISFSAFATESVTGTNHTFASADNGLMALRSNSAAAMADTLPGTGVGVLPQNWNSTIVNNDASALYFLTVGSGATLNGAVGGSLILGPTQRCIVLSDGANYWTTELPSRITLGANTTLYVSTAGSDSTNNGLTSASPWATIQHALTYISQSLDLNGFTVTIQLADGTYTTGWTLAEILTGGNQVVINGNSGTPTNVVISTTNANATVNNATGVVMTLQNMKIQTTTSGNCITSSQGAIVNIGNGIVFGPSAIAHVGATNNGIVYVLGNYTIAGSAQQHFLSVSLGQIQMGVPSATVTLTGTPAFSSSFASAALAALVDTPSITFSGSATGTRYVANTNAVINTNGSGASYFPGNVAGSTSTGGQYS